MNRKHLITWVSVAVLLLAGAGAFILSQSNGPIVLQIGFEPKSAQAESAEDAPEASKPESGIMYDLGAKVVNLADPGGYRLLRVSVVIELAPDHALASLKEAERKKEEEKLRTLATQKRAILDDAVVAVVSNKSFSEIFSMKGKQALKDELKNAFAERAPQLDVMNVYFTDFVIQ